MAPIKRVKIVEDDMTVLYEGKDPVVDIVFIHGLQGHPQRSWSAAPPRQAFRSPSPEPTKKKRSKFKSCFPSRSRSNSPSVPREVTPEEVFWPCDLLPQQFKDDNVRILTYGYDSVITHLDWRAENKNGIKSHAENFLASLDRAQHQNETERKLILVGHSLGGIIIKDALRQSKEAGQFRPHLFAVGLRIYAVITFGTPHRGSGIAALGLLAARTARLSGHSTNTTIVKDLAAGSQYLEMVHDAYMSFLAEHGIKVHSFHEERGMRGVIGMKGLIVTKDSATLQYPLEVKVGINGDHDSMCKFTSVDDDGFRKASYALKCYVDEIAKAAQLRQIEELKPKPLTQEHKDMLQGFFTSDYMSHRETLPARHEGTCQWIFQHPSYREWYSTQESMLWITGNPGMGKTILALTLLEHFEHDNTVQRVVYFFCDDKYENQRSFPAILRGIIHQILQIKTAERLEEHVRPHQLKKIYNSLATLWDIFVSLIGEIEGTTVCILDAMDECDETSRENFFLFMRDLFAKPPKKARKGKLKLVFTSRPHDSIRYGVLSLPESAVYRLKAEAEEKLINEDIAKYVDSEVKRLTRLRCYDSALASHVANTLKQNADGSFVWASLVIKILNKTSLRNVAKRLQEFPAGLETVYTRILADIPQDISDILMWVTNAVSPMRLHDLAVALAVKHGDPETQTYTITESDINMLRGDLELCYPLLKVQDSDDGTQLATVHLVHQSAKEFLQANAVKLGRLGLGRSDGNYEIALSCLTYLCSAHMKRGPICIFDENNPESKEVAHVTCQNKVLPIIKKWPFLSYATLNWHKHVQAADAHADGLWSPVLQSLMAGQKTELSNQLHAHFGSEWGVYTPGASPCLTLCRHGLQTILELCYRKAPGFAVDLPDSRGKTPLAIAALSGRLSIIQFLVGTGAAINLKDEDGNRPFEHAVTHGNSDVVQYFLDTGKVAADKETVPSKEPLYLAALYGHMNVVQLLSQTTGFNLSSTRFSYHNSPLHAAIEQSQIDILKFFVESRQVQSWLTSKNEEGVTTLSFAAQLGRVKPVRFLIDDAQMDPNMQDANGWTPLTWACSQGRKDVVKFLITLPNVEVDSQSCTRSCTPLMWAVRNGKPEVARILVESGRADIELKDRKFGRAALSWAVRGNHHILASYLVLEAKADVNSRDKHGRTPLWYAVTAANIINVELLINANADVDAEDGKGRTPFSLGLSMRKASDLNSRYIVILLKKNKGKVAVKQD